jgi:hypothetical protein
MTTLSRHDSKQMLLGIVEDFLLEISLQFEDTDEYQTHKFYLDDAFSEVLRIITILKDKHD